MAVADRGVEKDVGGTGAEYVLIFTGHVGEYKAMGEDTAGLGLPADGALALGRETDQPEDRVRDLEA